MKKGRCPGIYDTWDEAKKQVDGFPGAVYKSFPELSEVREFLKENSDALSNLKKVIIEDPQDVTKQMEALRRLFDKITPCSLPDFRSASEACKKAEKKYACLLSDPFLFDSHPECEAVAFVDGGGDKDAGRGWVSSLLPFGVVLFQNDNGIAKEPLLFRHVFKKSNPDFQNSFLIRGIRLNTAVRSPAKTKVRRQEIRTPK